MAKLVSFFLIAAVAAEAAEFVHAVDFPYASYPRHLWERELVWMKNIGVSTVAFSIPAAAPAADPRADLLGLLKLLRKLELRGWVRSAPAGMAAKLMPHTARHGGPIAFTDVPAIDAPAPPQPVTRLSATDPAALAKSRAALVAGRGSMVWTEVEDTLGPVYRAGVISFAGDERAGGAVIRRNALLLRRWGAVLPGLAVSRAVRKPVAAVEVYGRRAGAVAVTNATTAEVRGPLRLVDPLTRKALLLPAVAVPAGESMWLPVGVSIAAGGLCADCSVFPPQDRVMWATAELLWIEYENGILAMEFSAPLEAEAMLSLTSEPSGPYIAGGRPSAFDWNGDRKELVLKIPRGKGAGNRVRVAIAIAPPEASGFINDPPRLMIGRETKVQTSYSSADLAGRSRMLGPPGFTLTPERKGDLEIEYTVKPPADALHGEFVRLALEADGAKLGQARVQVMAPVQIRTRDAIALHVGAANPLAVRPYLVPLDARNGRTLTLTVRNNSAAIENFTVEASGDRVTFSPAKQEVVVGGVAEREIALRVFSESAEAGVRDAVVKIGSEEVRVRFVAIGRTGSVCYDADLDGDGMADRVVESAQARAAFSGADGRWLEFVDKDANANLIPEAGVAMAPAGCADLAIEGSKLTLRKGPALPPATVNGVTLRGESTPSGERVYVLGK